MKIAVLSSHIKQTIDWLKKEYKIKSFNTDTNVMTDYDGHSYHIISRPEHIYGHMFNQYIKAPDFYTLEDLVKAQVR